jgi:hypothetical protein
MPIPRSSISKLEKLPVTSTQRSANFGTCIRLPVETEIPYRVYRVSHQSKRATASRLRLCKTCKNSKNCCSTRLVAPTKKPLEREKRHNGVCDIAALKKISKQLSICQDQSTATNQRGETSVCFGHIVNKPYMELNGTWRVALSPWGAARHESKSETQS